MTRVLYGGKTSAEAVWRTALLNLRPALDLVSPGDGHAPESVDIVLYEPSGPIQDMAPYSGVAAIQSLWAGVETLLANDTLPVGPPLLRMVEEGLTLGMTDYVVGHVYRAHLGVAAQQADQAAKIWGSWNPPLSGDRRVGIVGLGALGRDAAETLQKLGFNVSGWSRTQKEIAGVTCLSGADGFTHLLSESEILVLLAPLTPQTHSLINAEALSKMQKNAHIINAARGQLIDEEALLSALDRGHIASATLDVMCVEPLPTEHRFWTHPNVMITPHIASVTRPETAAITIIEQIERFETGKPFLHTVERERGY